MGRELLLASFKLHSTFTVFFLETVLLLCFFASMRLYLLWDCI